MKFALAVAMAIVLGSALAEEPKKEVQSGVVVSPEAQPDVRTKAAGVILTDEGYVKEHDTTLPSDVEELQVK